MEQKEMSEYFGYCNRCGSILYSKTTGLRACKWGRCNGEVMVYRLYRPTKRTADSPKAGEITVTRRVRKSKVIRPAKSA